MTSLRSLTSALLAAALLALAACGGGGGDAAPTPVQVDTTRTARVTLGPAGGTVVATAADGRRYTLTVEPGALATATEITATPVVSMGSAPLAAGLKGAVRFGPAGLRFARPATLRIEGANPATSAGSKLVGFLRSADGASMQLVPTTVAAAGAMVMRVRHFTDVGVSQATAQEAAQVPIAPILDPVFSMLLEYVLSTASNTADTSALLVRLHDTWVVPFFTVAERSTGATAAERELAIEMAGEWFLMVGGSDVSDDFELLPGSLEPLVAALSQRVRAIATEDFEIGLAACMGPAPIGSAQLLGLENALRTQYRLGLLYAESFAAGLDLDLSLDFDVGRRLNDCVRIVFEPRPLPTFEVGRPVSLDLRARLVFAADANASIEVPFEFDVFSSTAAFGSEFFSTGFSDAQGNYTTVVTPSVAEPEFFVEACMMVSLRNGGPVASLLCGQQTLRGRATTRVTAQLPAQISAPTPLTVTVEVQTGNGQFAPAPNMLVEFTPTCATVNPTSGRTDASGVLSTTVTPNAGCSSVSVNAVARADVGTTPLAQQTVTASVSNNVVLTGLLTLHSHQDFRGGDGTTSPSNDTRISVFLTLDPATMMSRDASGSGVFTAIVAESGCFAPRVTSGIVGNDGFGGVDRVGAEIHISFTISGTRTETSCGGTTTVVPFTGGLPDGVLIGTPTFSNGSIIAIDFNRTLTIPAFLRDDSPRVVVQTGRLE